MDRSEIDRWLYYVEGALSRGNLEQAINGLKRALSVDPNLPEAHALLSVCLLDQRRLAAAEMEGKLALSLEPNLPSAHRAMGYVMMARRQFKEAESH